jgi:hypothetical protein
MEELYAEGLEDFLGLPRGTCKKCREMAKRWRRGMEKFLGIKREEGEG